MNDSNRFAATGSSVIAPKELLNGLFTVDAPSIFTFELTQLCNNNCSGCANIDLLREKSKSQTGFHIKNWNELLGKIAPLAKVIRLSGGEPTIHPEFEDIVKFVDALNIKHSLFTTGRWQPKKRDSIISLYAECLNTAGMLISLHGSKPAFHNAFVESTSNAFSETCNNIRLATANKINVFISTVLTKHSCQEIEEIIEKAMYLGASQVVFNRFIAVNHPLLPTHIQLREALEKIQSFNLQGYPCRIGNNIPPCFLPDANEVAKAGYELCHISTKGFIRPDNLTNLTFGNLYEQNIQEIWQSQIAQAYRRSVNFDCQQCSAFFQCRGGSKSIQIENNLPSDPLMSSHLDQFISSSNSDPKDDVFLALTSD